ncbi:TIGR03915 family putative DNA repair protein [Pedobacter sp. JCM 36344]|uniref:TIGR03915 family putative DNA repair protein n=1 Tax=Pedobacter sp. JCM 36344 TaxID=3374280 RepID=UPI003979866A
MIYIIDGSLESVLCAVFEWFERKPGKVLLKMKQHFEPDAFEEVFSVNNDPVKADRVWEGLQRTLDASWIRKYYCTFLSEKPDALVSLFEFTCYLFLNKSGAEQNYGNEYVLAIAQTARKVEREKHRMEAFIRFKQGADGMFYCGIDPDFNVIPLIMKHFKDRYADQKWVIYDLKRHYGIFYDLEKIEEIYLSKEDQRKLNDPQTDLVSEKEGMYSDLWINYFKSTNIVARKNRKLHMQHVPKRYWKYLTEKQGI